MRADCWRCRLRESDRRIHARRILSGYQGKRDEDGYQGRFRVWRGDA